MSYYALTDLDWPWDDENEGRSVIVRADTPEEAVKAATDMHLKECPGAGGITWKVARLNLIGFQDAEWGNDNTPAFGGFTQYDVSVDGKPGKSRPKPIKSKLTEEQLQQMSEDYGCGAGGLTPADICAARIDHLRDHQEKTR